ncbi:ion channel [Hydrogenimonas sp. SS33]|uniref:potassium channel family protein n=1 Tax=Hydrogenimonas leucolamina TaxID=2954236 RepID=UPI00336BF7A6
MKKGLTVANAYLLFYFLLVVAISEAMVWLEPRYYHDFFDGFWWAIVTATTVGYGDMVPHTETGKIIAMVIIIGGVVAVSLFTAQMASYLVAMKIQAKKGYEMLEELDRHLVICGFKTPRIEVLEGFKKRYGTNIVIVYPELVPELERVLNEHGLKFAKGEYNDEAVLKEARIEKAEKVMILNMHDEYADAKVLETVIVIRSLNRDVYIIAEINDPKYENYLIKSKCDEIIMSEEYNRFLLSKSITEPGMSKVIRNLLRTQNFHIVTRHPFVGKTYGEAFKTSMEKNEILLGVVTNYVTGAQLKKILLTKMRFGGESEKYKKLLTKAKRGEIEMDVVINPSDDYVIPEFSAIIIMER